MVLEVELESGGFVTLSVIRVKCSSAEYEEELLVDGFCLEKDEVEEGLETLNH